MHTLRTSRLAGLAFVLFTAACGSSSDPTSSYVAAPGEHQGSTDTSGGSRKDPGTAYYGDASSPPPAVAHDAGSAARDASAVPSADSGVTEVRKEAGTDAGPVACEELDKSKPTTLYLSSDDSNSMASPVIARRLIRSGSVPSPGLIRTYEFLNYYNVKFDTPAQGSLGLSTELRPGSALGEVELQIGVQSAPAPTTRRPLSLTLVLDTSGSMMGKPIELQKAAVRAIAKQLKSGDIVSAITWNTQQQVKLNKHVAVGPNDSTVLDMANNLNTNGGTDLNSGLVRGYALAQEAYASDRINRVIVISDGIANVGETNATMIGQQAEDNDKEAIYLVGVGVGDGVNDTLMNTITDAGRGAYVYLDSEQEAERMLSQRFDEVMDVAARAVQVKATFPWYFQMKTFYGEEYSTDPAKVKPQHLAPGDSMVFQQILRGCTGSMTNESDAFEVTATWIDPFTYASHSVSMSSTVSAMYAKSADRLARGRAIVRFAEALKLSYRDQPAALDEAEKAADQADPNKLDAELNEIRELITAEKRLVVRGY